MWHVIESKIGLPQKHGTEESAIGKPQRLCLLYCLGTIVRGKKRRDLHDPRRSIATEHRKKHGMIRVATQSANRFKKRTIRFANVVLFDTLFSSLFPLKNSYLDFECAKLLVNNRPLSRSRIIPDTEHEQRRSVLRPDVLCGTFTKTLPKFDRFFRTSLPLQAIFQADQ